MASTTMLGNILSGLAFLLAVVSLVFLIVIGHLFATTPLLVAVQVASVLLMIWARLAFGIRSFHATASTSEGGLVTSGPYRFWRHPIYASIIYFVWAGQFPSRNVLAPVGAGAVTLFLFCRMVLEERFLRAAYPEYDAYSKQAKRFIPFVL